MEELKLRKEMVGSNRKPGLSDSSTMCSILLLWMDFYIMRAILAFISSEPTSVQHSTDSLLSHLPVTWKKISERHTHFLQRLIWESSLPNSVCTITLSGSERALLSSHRDLKNVQCVSPADQLLCLHPHI